MLTTNSSYDEEVFVSVRVCLNYTIHIFFRFAEQHHDVKHEAFKSKFARNYVSLNLFGITRMKLTAC